MLSSLSKAVSTTTKALNSIKNVSGTVAKGIGKTMAATGKAVGVMGATAATGIVAITKNAIEAYSEYEQLVGGIDTLFKESSEKVQQYASEAYKTAGMSANEYMNTATSFSASLLQSLGGDTAKAAEYANQAIIDMSDNANKMGTSIDMIQNAYQGFAKQNYTMLDNLKLGYGGTKEEMQRLLEDAEKISGIKYDISSFADITQAINVIQTEMGITGTTAKEASTTIQGSFGMLKSSWENLMTGLADPSQDMGALISNVVDSAVTLFGNVMPVISNILDNLPAMFKTLLEKALEVLPDIITSLVNSIAETTVMWVQTLANALPMVIETIVGMIPTVIDAIIQIGEAILQALPSIIQSIAQSLPTLIPLLIDGAVQLIVMLCSNFSSIIQPLIDALPDILIYTVEALMNNLPVLISGAVQLVVGIVRAIPQITMALVKSAPTILWLIVEGLIKSTPVLIQGFVDIFGQCISNILNVFSEIGSFFVNLWETIAAAAPEAWKNIQKGFSVASKWFKDSVITPVTGFFSGMWTSVTAGASKAWTGIQNVFSNVATFFGNIFGKAWEGVKAVFSTGGKIFDGIKEGIVNSFKFVVNALIKGINKVVKIPFEGLNTVLENINDIEILELRPFDWLTWRAPIPQIPQLATGGNFDGRTPQLAIVGDAPETMVPHGNTPRNRALLAEAAKGVGVGIGTSNIINITFAPVINGGSGSDVRQALKDGEIEFERKMEEYFRKKGRVSFA